MLEISPTTTHEGLDRLLPEWTELYDESCARNPFAHPAWVAAWARRFVDPSCLYVLTARCRRRLVGVAPLHRVAGPPGSRVASLRLLGDGRSSPLVELPQVLCAPDESRRVLRAVVAHLCERGHTWDWVERVLAPGQGWFEREWIPRRGPGSGCVVMHKGTRAFVVLPLAPTWEELRGGLKRNVKESIRRGTNRLGAAGHEWRLVEPTAGSVEGALGTLVALHRARAAMNGTSERHADLFRDVRHEAFLQDVGRRLAPGTGFSPLVLEVDGTPVAARLVLETRDAAFFSVSGSDPAWWRYNAGTTLLALALRRAIDQGCVAANLSHGPDVSKLRWSERLEFAQSFLLVGERLRSRVAFTAFWHLRADYMRRDQRGRQLRGRRALVS
jgi:CelD/BcsL family acetyltransferase involved in cellulose biosynthesis